MAIKLVDIKYCITCGGSSKASTTGQGFSCCKVILSTADDCKAKLNDYSMNGQMEYCYMCGHCVTTEKDVVFCNDCTETAVFDPPKISIKRSDIHYCPLCSKQLCPSKCMLLCKNCSCRIPISDDSAAESRLVEYCIQGKVRFCYSCGGDVKTNGEFVMCLKKECKSKLPLTKAQPIDGTSPKTSSLPTLDAQSASSRPDTFMQSGMPPPWPGQPLQNSGFQQYPGFETPQTLQAKFGMPPPVFMPGQPLQPNSGMHPPWFMPGQPFQQSGFQQHPGFETYQTSQAKYGMHPFWFMLGQPLQQPGYYYHPSFETPQTLQDKSGQPLQHPSLQQHQKLETVPTLPVKSAVSTPLSMMDQTLQQPQNSEIPQTLQAKSEAEKTMTSTTMATVSSPEKQNVVPLADMLKSGYQRIPDATDCSPVYQILAYPLATMKDQKVNRVGICEKVSDPAIAHKVFMLLGETGSGKTTLLNFLANYILDVKWEDPFRFVLVPDGKDQTKSQTQRITAYTFHCVPKSNLKYNFTLIDTPGFGDTRGIETDKLIVDQIREFFTLPPPCGIDHLDGIALVVKAHGTRLTALQKYVFTSVVSLFGKDLEKNIFILATHADDSPPAVIDTLKACGIPADMNMTLKFNNNTLFLSPEKRGSFSQLYWKMGVEGAKNLFSKLQAVKGVSLTLTKEVLIERRQLEEQLKGMQEIIHEFMAHISVIEQEKKVLHQYQESADASKNYTYEVDVHKQRVVSLKPGEYVTNCTVCNITCHRDCTIPDDGEKYRCAAMTPKEKDNAICTVCPKQCSWERHRNNDFRYEIYIEKETRTYEDLKKRYEESIQGKFSKEALLKQLENEEKQYNEEVQRYITNAYTSIQRLETIALKPNPLSEVEYIELLIEAEIKDGQPGFPERVKQYEKAKEKAIILRKIKTKNVKDLVGKK